MSYFVMRDRDAKVLAGPFETKTAAEAAAWDITTTSGVRMVYVARECCPGVEEDLCERCGNVLTAGEYDDRCADCEMGE